MTTPSSLPATAMQKSFPVSLTIRPVVRVTPSCGGGRSPWPPFPAGVWGVGTVTADTGTGLSWCPLQLSGLGAASCHGE